MNILEIKKLEFINFNELLEKDDLKNIFKNIKHPKFIKNINDFKLSVSNLYKNLLNNHKIYINIYNLAGDLIFNGLFSDIFINKLKFYNNQYFNIIYKANIYNNILDLINNLDISNDINDMTLIKYLDINDKYVNFYNILDKKVFSGKLIDVFNQLKKIKVLDVWNIIYNNKIYDNLLDLVKNLDNNNIYEMKVIYRNYDNNNNNKYKYKRIFNFNSYNIEAILNCKLNNYILNYYGEKYNITIIKIACRIIYNTYYSYPLCMIPDFLINNINYNNNELILL